MVGRSGRSIEPVPTAGTPSLAELRRELEAAGLGRPAAVRIFVKFLALTAAAAALLAAVLVADLPWWALALAAALSAWFLTAAIMCGHDGAHGAASSRDGVNSLLAHLGFSLLGGLSVNYWKHKHNALHHPNVNVAAKDPDIQQRLLALSARQHQEQGTLVRALQRNLQTLGFWLVGAPLLPVALRVKSLLYLLAELRAGRRARANLGDLAWCCAHYLMWLVLPLPFLGWPTTLLLYGVSTPLLGVYLACIFAPAHMPYPLVKETRDPLLLQLASTRDFSAGWFFRTTLIGLNRQIEHHLAQRLHHLDLERAAPIVRDYCRRHGLPYEETSWLRALIDTSRQLGRGWDVEEVVIGGVAA